MGYLFIIVGKISNTDKKRHELKRALAHGISRFDYLLKEKDAFVYNTNYKNLAWTYVAQGNVSWDEFWHEDYCGKNDITSLGDVVFADFGGFVGKYMDKLWSNFAKLRDVTR